MKPNLRPEDVEMVRQIKHVLKACGCEYLGLVLQDDEPDDYWVYFNDGVSHTTMVIATKDFNRENIMIKVLGKRKPIEEIG